MPDFIANGDQDFIDWLVRFNTYLGANAVALGLVAADATALGTAMGALQAAYQDQLAKQDAAKEATALKKAKRADVEKLVRALNKKIQANPNVTDAQKTAAGLPVRDTTPTPVGPLSSRPILRLSTAESQRLTIHFADESTPTKKAKPHGALGAAIYIHKGAEEPTKDSDWQLLAIDTATPYVYLADQAEIGTRVWIRAAWINTQQELGPWSATVNARIPG